MIACSTCWNSGRHTEGIAMIQEILDLGFDYVELGHGIRMTLVDGILRMVEQGKVKISSLHNFCPLPVEITRSSPDCYQFSSGNPPERDRALRHTFQTIDFARRLGAKYVVLHMGSVRMDDYTDRLLRLAEVGLHTSNQFIRTRLEGLRKRAAGQEAAFHRSLHCMQKIYEYAAERKIKLGIESRHSFEEIPSEQEMEILLNEFPAPVAGYWHDFGHVQVKHNLGFLNHTEWLQKVAPRLIGCHLHDTAWPGRDHMAPFTGDVKYDELMALVPAGTPFIFEMSPKRTKEEITTALAKWRERFGECE
jgi:sugar phosphate isomerase/epimerase